MAVVTTRARPLSVSDLTVSPNVPAALVLRVTVIGASALVTLVSGAGRAEAVSCVHGRRGGAPKATWRAPARPCARHGLLGAKSIGSRRRRRKRRRLFARLLQSLHQVVPLGAFTAPTHADPVELLLELREAHLIGWFDGHEHSACGRLDRSSVYSRRRKHVRDAQEEGRGHQQHCWHRQGALGQAMMRKRSPGEGCRTH
eukprot:4049569-Prymnesium_polylepis.2